MVFHKKLRGLGSACRQQGRFRRLLVLCDDSYLGGLQPGWGSRYSGLLWIQLQQCRHSVLNLWHPHFLEIKGEAGHLNLFTWHWYSLLFSKALYFFKCDDWSSQNSFPPTERTKSVTRTCLFDIFRPMDISNQLTTNMRYLKWGVCFCFFGNPQTPFHPGSHQYCGWPQRAECNFETIKDILSSYEKIAIFDCYCFQ